MRAEQNIEKIVGRKKRVVMMVGTWPEENYADTEVTEVRTNETDKEAINRAKRMYSQKDEFYIKEI